MTAEEFQRKRSRKGIVTGLVIIAIGVVMLLRRMDIYLPDWVLSWEMFLIVIGLAIGINSEFRRPASWILMLIGTVFLINDIYYIPVNIRDFIWPVMIIAVGLIILLRPRRNRYFKESDAQGEIGDRWKDRRYSKGYEYDKANTIDTVSIFNGLKKIVLSKNFKGGETVNVFGGTEINLLQADFEGTVTLDAVVVFGGLKLIVPPNWEVRTNVTSILGGVEDKRHTAVEVVPDDKVLILTGTVLFGGLDIVSY